jgi:hypothetical protein
VQEFEAFAIFCWCAIFFDEVLDICGDVHTLEPAVTIGRTRRTVADEIEVDCRTDPRLFARRSSDYFRGSRTCTTHDLVPALRAGGSGQPA